MTAPTIEPIEALRRRQFLRVSAESLAALALGCRPLSDRALARGDTVIVGVPGAGFLNPMPAFDQELWLAFLPLVALTDKGELEGRLAERWEHSADYRERTYFLRRDVRWHDGAPVTAHDVKFSLGLLTNPDVGELGPDAIESIVVLDDYTVRIRQRGDDIYAWWEISYPKHLLEHLDPKHMREWAFWQHPVGNGPYRFGRQVPQTMMEFEANPDFYGGKPAIPRVVLKFVGEGGLAELLAGNIDGLTRVNPAWIPSLAADARFQMYYSHDAEYRDLVWQTRDPLFRDARVRRALTLAINRRELLELLHYPEDAPLTDGPVTRRQLLRGELEEPLPYDPAQARQLLEAAGWYDRTDGGVRERGGVAFRFTALAPGSYQEMAIYVQAQLRRVGVEMVVQARPGVRAAIGSGEFQAAFDDVWSRMPFKYHSTGYQNARVLALVNRVAVIADPDEEDRAFVELRKLFREEVPVTYLAPNMSCSVLHRRVRGLGRPGQADPLRFMNTLWLDHRSPT